MVTAELESLYDRYIDEAEQAEMERRPGDGLLGIGKTPDNDPCHDRFVNDLETIISHLSEDGRDSSEMLEQLLFIYKAPLEHRKPASVYWMLLAVHGMTLPMIRGLDVADAESLSQWYKEKYPRRERFPAQKQVIKTLKDITKR